MNSFESNFESVGEILKRHNPLHNVVISDNKGYCVECEMEKQTKVGWDLAFDGESAHVIEAYGNHPIHGESKYWVCSVCGKDVWESEGKIRCERHGLL